VAVSDNGVVEAAGGVVVRVGDGAEQVLVVHRPRYDDWSLPKGKLDPGETYEDAAIREVEEETGWRCTLDLELEPVRYRDHKGRPKHVRFWRMTPQTFTGCAATDEVDDVRWLSFGEAATLLSYDMDRRLLEQARADDSHSGV
jgi:8-oxo-dGTP diphosphatase